MHAGLEDDIALKIRQAEIASAFGAGVLGFGLGAVAAAQIGGLAWPAIFLGIAIHGWGMASKHGLERSAGWASTWWNEMLFRLCWAALAILAVVFVAALFV
jgi:hypothetical protein